MTTEVPDDALHPDGVPYWLATTWPGKRTPIGAQHRIAAYLYFNVEVGHSFTLRRLRQQIESDGPNTDEHIGRRLRALRKEGWRFHSYKDTPNQAADVYVLQVKGARTWLGEKQPASGPSAATRRLVLDRDGRRCVVCGIEAGVPYSDIDPPSPARLTIGHRVPGARLADATPDNLQAECARCNEPVGDSPPDPEQMGAVLAAIKRLGAKDKSTLFEWIQQGRRTRSKLDLAFDRYRMLSASERSQVASHLRETTGGVQQ